MSELADLIHVLERKVLEIEWNGTTDTCTYDKLIQQVQVIHDRILDLQLAKSSSSSKKRKRDCHSGARLRDPLTFLERDGLVKVIHVDEKTNEVVTKYMREGCKQYMTVIKFNTNEEAEHCADQLVGQLKVYGFK